MFILKFPNNIMPAQELFYEYNETLCHHVILYGSFEMGTTNKHGKSLAVSLGIPVQRIGRISVVSRTP